MNEGQALSEITLLLKNIDNGQNCIGERLLIIEEKVGTQAENGGRIEEKLSHLITDLKDSKTEWKSSLEKKAGKEEVERIAKKVEKIDTSLTDYVKAKSLTDLMTLLEAKLKTLESKLKAFMYKSVLGVVGGLVALAIKMLYDALTKGKGP